MVTVGVRGDRWGGAPKVDTTYEMPDWREQMHLMMGPDAPDMIRRFEHIIDTHVPFGEPVTKVELAFSQEEIYRDLPQLKLWLDGQDCDEQVVRNLMFNLGVELCRQYMTEEAVEYNEPCSDAIPYFFGSEDDWIDPDDDDGDDDDSEGE